MMMVNKRAKWPSSNDSVDRISELSVYILHLILSFLDSDDACRASVLSKAWYDAWSSVPVLDFQPKYFKKDSSGYTEYCEEFYDEGTLERFVGFVDKTMRRYFEQKYHIRKFHLEFPKVDEELQPLLDKWIGTAVQNQVQEMNIKILLRVSPDYVLPEILFSSRTLRVLDCYKVEISYYPDMKLRCVEHLSLFEANVDDCMLQQIIDFCPLIGLKLSFCFGLTNISIPWSCKKHDTGDCFGAGKMRTNIERSALRTFEYENVCDYLWPFRLNSSALGNLSKLELTGADITDDIVSELTYGLASLESLVLSGCLLLKNIKISSTSLKELYIVECQELEEATVDAPNLLSFWYNGRLSLDLSVINSQEQCVAHYYAWVEPLSTEWFIKLKKFLTTSTIFEILEIRLSSSISQIELEEDLLRKTSTGLPYKLKEMILDGTCDWMLTDSSLLAFLDCLLWSCHPDVLSIPTSFHNKTVELILNALKDKVKCWRHPLKAIDIEHVDSSALLSRPSELVLKFRLSWLPFPTEMEHRTLEVDQLVDCN